MANYLSLPNYKEVIISSKDAATGGGAAFTVEFNPGLVFRTLWVKEIYLPQSIYAFRVIVINGTSYNPGFRLRHTVIGIPTDYNVAITPGTYTPTQFVDMITPSMPVNTTLTFSSTDARYTISSDIGGTIQLFADNAAELVSLRNIGYFSLEETYDPIGGLSKVSTGIAMDLDSSYTVTMPGTPFFYIQSAVIGGAAASPVSTCTSGQYTQTTPTTFTYEEIKNIIARITSNSPYIYTLYQNPQVSERSILMNTLVEIKSIDFTLVDMWGYPVDLNGGEWEITIGLETPS